MTVGPMQGVADAIAEGNQEIGGKYSTRLSLAVDLGDSTWAVESVFGWPSSGEVLVRGVVYTYTTRSDTSLEGISYNDGVTTIVGAAEALPLDSVVTDVSLNRNAIELARGALLVNRALSTDIDVVGRNLGVNRYPSVPSDETFRAIVKALGYNPRGTIFGMELFLNAAFGAGNYEIIEDLIEEPNIVKVRLLGTSLSTDEILGKAFLQGGENLLPDATKFLLTLSEEIVANGAMHSVRFLDENHYSDFRTARPSVETLVEYVGSPGVKVWTYTGAKESTDVVVLSNNQGCEISDTSGGDPAQYSRVSRITPEAVAGINVLTYVDSASVLGTATTTLRQWGAAISDGAYRVSWGIRGLTASTFGLAFDNVGTLFGDELVLNYDTYYDIELRKYGTDRVELWVNGALRLSTAYSNFTTATGNPSFAFGSSSTPQAATIGRVKHCGFYAFTNTDYWAGHGEAGAVLAASPTVIDVGAPDGIFAAGDVGKRFYIRGGAIGVSGGSNNGVYEISVVNSSQNLTLKGEDQINGFVETTKPTQFNAASRVFQYPDDIGKNIVISGSVSNDGSRVIVALLDPDDDTDYSAPGVFPDLDSWATRVPLKTNRAIVSGGSPYVTETGLSWRLDPVFADETGLVWEAADMGSVAGTAVTLSQALPDRLPVKATYSTVLSAQMLANVLVSNAFVSAGPPQINTHFPFYLADPLGFVRQYMDLLTAAGVIPVLLED